MGSEAQVDNHLMVDFETLGTSADSILLSAGLVVFNRDEADVDHEYLEFAIVPQLLAGRTVSRDTLNWWKKGNESELYRLTEDGDESLRELVAIVERIKRMHKIKKVWSRGSMDVAILENIGALPFPYYAVRDCRTLDEFMRMEYTNSHHAIQDCHNQIKHVRKVLWNV